MNKCPRDSINYYLAYILISIVLFLGNCSGLIENADNSTNAKDSIRTQDSSQFYLSGNLIKDTVKISKSKANETNIDFICFLNKITTPSEYFSFSSKENKILAGSKGSIIFIPENSFTLENGNDYTGNIKFDVKEIFDKDEMLLSFLQTRSNDKVLVSDGMMHIDCKGEKGESLKIKNGANLYFEIPIENRNPDKLLFNGKRDFSNQMNWTIGEKQIDKTMISIPLEYLKFTYWIWGSGDNKENERIKKQLSELVQKVKNAKYENTFLATREFTKRFYFAAGIGHSLYRQSKAFDEVLNIYTKNLDKDLWYSDSLAYVMLKTELAKQRNNLNTKTYNQFLQNIKQFENFYNEKLTKVQSLNDYGIDLSLPNASFLLVKKGITQFETSDILRKYKIRQEVIKGISKNSIQM